MNAENTYHVRQRVVFGLLLICGGVAVLLDRADIIELRSSWHYWPAIILIIGINQLLGADRAKHVISGLWTVFIAAWLYVSIEKLWGLTFANTWPFFLIAWGVTAVLRPILEKRLDSNLITLKEDHHGR